MEAYKVARREDTHNSQYPLGSKYRLRWGSAIVLPHSKYYLSYGIGKTTDPRIGGGIFAFETIAFALDFLNGLTPRDRYDILVCHGVIDKEASGYGFQAVVESDFDLFWQSPKEYSLTKTGVPAGTIVCTSVISLNVWKENNVG